MLQHYLITSYRIDHLLKLSCIKSINISIFILRSQSPPLKQVDQDEDEEGVCAICFDNFKQVGDHRITSLKCGHIFGYGINSN